MKNTNKYIKTRRQINAAKANSVAQLVQLVQTNAHQKQTTYNGKDQEHPNTVVNNKAQKPHKTKKIYKNKQPNTLMNHTKSPQIITKSQKKQKLKIPPKINHIKIGKKYTKKKAKIQQEKTKQSNHLINIEAKTNLVDGVLTKKKSGIKKAQNSGSQTKMSIKEENAQNQSVIKENYSIPKKLNKTQKFKIQSKLIQDIQPSQANHLQQLSIIPAQQPPQPIKKKGRPKKIIIQQISEVRTPEEYVKLEQFIQNSIKLRKLKNQKQFFECFSRINQYAQESWEYGDLNKQLSWAPQRQEVLKIGIPIARGIRKQIQQQLLNNSA